MTCLDSYQPFNRVRTDGRIRAAGTSMRELHAEVRERSHRGYDPERRMERRKNGPSERCQNGTIKQTIYQVDSWSGRQDSNLRPSAPKAVMGQNHCGSQRCRQALKSQ